MRVGGGTALRVRRPAACFAWLPPGGLLCMTATGGLFILGMARPLRRFAAEVVKRRIFVPSGNGGVDPGKVEKSTESLFFTLHNCLLICDNRSRKRRRRDGS